MLQEICAIVCLFFTTVTAHELGHFTVAYWLGIKIDKFALGVGPTIINFKASDISIEINLIPIAGYVVFNTDEKNYILENLSYLKKSAVYLAGIGTNILLSFLMFFLAQFIPNNNLDANIQPKSSEYVVTRPLETSKIVTAAHKMVIATRLLGKSSIAALQAPDPLAELSGPVSIALIATDQAKKGFHNYLTLIAVFSMGLALLNLLPLGGLDGGGFCLITLEAIFNKKIPSIWKQYINRSGFILLGLLILLATVKDYF